MASIVMLMMPPNTAEAGFPAGHTNAEPAAFCLISPFTYTAVSYVYAGINKVTDKVPVVYSGTMIIPTLIRCIYSSYVISAHEDLVGSVR
jgi:hypothetical protein